jgi:hypothetical protein
MTERDWLTEPDPARCIEFVADRLGPRRARLLAVALCRLAGELSDAADLRAAVEVAERYADGGVTRAELERARQAARESAVKAHDLFATAVEGGRLANPPGPQAPWYETLRDLAWVAAYAATSPVPLPDLCSKAESAGANRIVLTEFPHLSANAVSLRVAQDLRAAIRSLVRDVAGNPFRPVAFDPGWRTGTVSALAGQMYESREFAAMPILADALQDAGCGDEHILNHLRGDSPHVRGCWVIDGILGKG